MATNLLLDSCTSGGKDFTLRLDDADPQSFSIGQLEAIARGLKIGAYEQEFEFEDDISAEAVCADTGVHLCITVGDESWYEGTASLSEYFRLTRRLCDECNL